MWSYAPTISLTRRAFSQLGHPVVQLLHEILRLETSNRCTAFLGVTASLLRSGGQLAAIVPHSLANGTYFKPFREWSGRSMVFAHLHLCERRRPAF